MEPPIQASELHRQYKKVQPKEILQSSDESDLEYHEMAQTLGWKRLKEFIENQIQVLNTNPGVDETDTVETIGFKYLATQTAKAYLEQVIQVVEASHEYIREQSEQ